ncbi:hypothetical protein OV142_43995 [Nannocystis sp. SCPEA4]|nr:hypothetical protein [Nannocystis sp. SCPEA4]
MFKTLGKGADKESKDLARAHVENALLRTEVREAEEQQKKIAERANAYAVSVNQQREQEVADITGTTVVLTSAGAGLGFIGELVLPSVMPNYPGLAKSIPYIIGALGAVGSYVLTEPSDLERQQGVRPDTASRYAGIGTSIGIMAGAGLAQVGTTITDAILKAIPQGS